LLQAFGRAVAAERLQHALVGAAVAAGGVAVVALLAGVDHGVAADFQLAGRAAAVTGLGVAVVALFRTFDQRVTAHRLERAGGATTVAVLGVGVVALLAERGLARAVAADLGLADR